MTETRRGGYGLGLGFDAGLAGAGLACAGLAGTCAAGAGLETAGVASFTVPLGAGRGAEVTARGG